MKSACCLFVLLLASACTEEIRAVATTPPATTPATEIPETELPDPSTLMVDLTEEEALLICETFYADPENIACADGVEVAVDEAFIENCAASYDILLDGCPLTLGEWQACYAASIADEEHVCNPSPGVAPVLRRLSHSTGGYSLKLQACLAPVLGVRQVPDVHDRRC